MIEQLLKKIHEAKQEYLQGNDLYEILNEMDIIVSKRAIELGIVYKMPKSNNRHDYKDCSHELAELIYYNLASTEKIESVLKKYFSK